MALEIITYNPADGAKGASVSADIVLTFSENIQKGTGNIVLKSNDVPVETFDVAQSDKIFVNGATLAINPTADLAYLGPYVVEIPAGAITDMAGNPYAGTTTYDFATVPIFNAADTTVGAPLAGSVYLDLVRDTNKASQWATYLASVGVLDASGNGKIGDIFDDNQDGIPNRMVVTPYSNNTAGNPINYGLSPSSTPQLPSVFTASGSDPNIVGTFKYNAANEIVGLYFPTGAGFLSGPSGDPGGGTNTPPVWGNYTPPPEGLVFTPGQQVALDLAVQATDANPGDTISYKGVVGQMTGPEGALVFTPIAGLLDIPLEANAGHLTGNVTVPAAAAPGNYVLRLLADDNIGDQLPGTKLDVPFMVSAGDPGGGTNTPPVWGNFTPPPEGLVFTPGQQVALDLAVQATDANPGDTISYKGVVGQMTGPVGDLVFTPVAGLIDILLVANAGHLTGNVTVPAAAAPGNYVLRLIADDNTGDQLPGTKLDVPFMVSAGDPGGGTNTPPEWGAYTPPPEGLVFTPGQQVALDLAVQATDANPVDTISYKGVVGQMIGPVGDLVFTPVAGLIDIPLEANAGHLTGNVTVPAAAAPGDYVLRLIADDNTGDQIPGTSLDVPFQISDTGPASEITFTASAPMNMIRGTDSADTINADALQPAGNDVTRDLIYGYAGDDIINAGAGGDRITGGAGNDVINGGESTLAMRLDPEVTKPGLLENRASYSGPAADYTITPHTDDASGTVTGVAGALYYTVADNRTSSPEGTDTIFQIDALQFSDELIRLTPAVFFSQEGETTRLHWNGTDAADVINAAAAEVAAHTTWKDSVMAGAGDDVITTGGGGDWIDGGAGDDTIDGGDNGAGANGWENNDAVNYAAPMRRFDIASSQDAEGVRTYTVTDQLAPELGGLGTDTLTNVETLNFSDGSKQLQVQFNASGMQNNITGTDYADTINADALAAAAIVPGTVALKTGVPDTLDITLTSLPAGVQKFVAVVGILNPGMPGQPPMFTEITTWDQKTMSNIPVTVKLELADGHLTGSYLFSNLMGQSFALQVYAADSNGVKTGASLQQFTASLVTDRDNINAGGGDDIINAGAGGDWISGGAGNDIINGGNDTLAARLDPTTTNTYELENQAQYTGLAKNYTVTRQTDDGTGAVTGTPNAHYYTVKDNRSGSPDGTDTVLNIDALQFSDKQVRLTPNLWFNNNGSPKDISLTVTSGVDKILQASDFDAGAFNGITINMKPVSGSLKLDGQEVQNWQTISYADIDAGKLVFTPPPGDVTKVTLTGISVQYLYVQADGSNFADAIGAVPGSTAVPDQYNFSGSDRLAGGAGADTLYGGAGADTLRGDAGNDRLDGGANRTASPDGGQQWDPNGSHGADVAEYAGKAERYVVAKLEDDGNGTVTGTNGGTYYTVTDTKVTGGEGIDTLTNIEVLRFADGEKNLQVVSSPMQNWVFDPQTQTSKGTVTGMNWDGTDWADTIGNASDDVTWKDHVRAGAGDDVIKTGGGGDWIDSGEGDDVIDGGANGTGNNSWDNNDIVQYDASMSRFNIGMTEDVDGKRTFTVADKLSEEFGGLGSDTLNNVEILQFTDGSKELQVSYNSMGSQNDIRGTDFSDRIDADILAGRALSPNTIALKIGVTDTLDIILTSVPAGVQKFVAVLGYTYPDMGGGSPIFTPAMETLMDPVTHMPVMDPVTQMPKMVPLTVNLDLVSGHLTGSYLFSNLSGQSFAFQVYAADEQGAQTGNSLEQFDAALVTDRDNITAGGGNDVVYAGAGGDRMADGAGNDFYDGGANGSSGNSWDNQDTVQFSGAQKRFKVEVLSYNELAADAKLDDVQSKIDGHYADPADRPVNVVRVTDKLPDGDGVNYLLNVEQIQFTDAQVNLGVTVNKWTPPPNPSPGMDTWVGTNNYDGGILNDSIDASDHDAALPDIPVDGFYSNRDSLRGGAGNDTLLGGAGGDDLTGDSGNDILDGGANGTGTNQWDNLDRANFSNSINRYDIQFYRPAGAGETGEYDDRGLTTGTKAYLKSGYYVDGGFIVVTDRYSDAMGGEGRDVLRNIEQLSFSDAWESLAVQYNDSTFVQNNWGVIGKDQANNDIWGNIETTVTNRSAWGTRFGDLIVGSDTANNQLNGNAGNDRIVGGALRDELTGGSGNDIIDGGANPAVDPARPWDTWNSYDTARYDAQKAQFNIERLIDDSQGTVTGQAGQVYYRVQHLIPAKLGGLGTDIVFDVERLQFSGNDGDVQLEVRIDQGGQPFQDFNGNWVTPGTSYMGTMFADSITGTSGNDNFMGDTGSDTIHGGAGDDNIGAGAGNDILYGDAGNDRFVNLSSGNDSVDGGDGTDTVSYEDALARFTIKLVRDGNELATYTTADKFGAGVSFTAATDVITVTDSLSSDYGGEGTDRLSNVEKITFNDGELDLVTGQFTGKGGGSFEPDTMLTVTPEGAAQAVGLPVLSVSATVRASDNTDHAIPDSSHDPIITIPPVSGKDFWAFKALDNGVGTVTLPQGSTIAGYSGGDLRFEFGDLELTGLQVVPGLSTETWTNADAGTSYFRLYGKGQLIATGSAMEVKAMTNTDPASQNYTKATGTVTVTLAATASDLGFVKQLADAQGGSTTITLNLDSFASEAPPDYNPPRAVTNVWNFSTSGSLDDSAFNELPVWDHWSLAEAPVFLAGSTVNVDIPVLATDPEGSALSYAGILGYNHSGVFAPLDGSSPVTLSASASTLMGSFTAPTVDDPNLVMRVYAYDDGATQQHGSFIDIPFVVRPDATSAGGKTLTGTDVNDNLNGSNGDDLLLGGAGDDVLNGGAGNDTLNGGTDTASSGSNFWGGGDTAQYFGAPRARFDIVRNDDGSFTIIDIASVKNPVFANGHLTASSYLDDTGAVDNTKVSSEIGYGVDTLTGVERINFSDGQLDLAPLDRSYTYRSTWGNGPAAVEYDVTRHDITGTFMDDVLTGSTYGDQIDGRAGNDTIDGGVEDITIGNVWEIQDVVRYEGSRERYTVKGVLVEIAETESGKTYTVVSAAEASATAVFGIQVTDVLPASAGGSGTDLLVNVERVEFSGSQLNIKPQISEWYDSMSKTTSVNAQGTEFDDVIAGKDGNDWLSGGAGNDSLVGGAGGDELEGGGGDDLILGGADGAVDQWGNSRSDTARYNAPFDRFEITSTTVDLDGDGTAETAALQVKDLLPADASGSLGTDTLVGVESLAFNNRWVDVGIRRWGWTDWQGNVNANAEGTVFGDLIYGDRNTDGTEAATSQRDYLRGNAGDDVMIGGGSGDELTGGEGHDVLDGGANGATGDAWQDQDTARFNGNSGRYSIQTITITTDSGTGISTIMADGAQIATFNDTALTITATGLADGVAQSLQNAYNRLSLADGQHNSGYLVVDTLSSDLGGEGADLVFNVESLSFLNGPLEIDIRANVSDWNNDGKLDWVNITGTGGSDKVDLERIVTLTGKTEAQLTATRIDVDFREGNDVFTGGSGGESVRTGAGNDYVDGGDNVGTDQWGGSMRDEVRFEGKFSRYTLIDVTLSKSDAGWTLSSSKGSGSTTSEWVSSWASAYKLSVDDLTAAVQAMQDNAGSNTSVTGWLVADRLPASFDGTGIDAVVNVEALAFSDKWMPLDMQIFYQRDSDPALTTPWEQRAIVSAYVDGTQMGDAIGYDAGRYNYGGDDNLRGNEGNDTINGGAGGDWISGGPGDDVIDGGANGTDLQGNIRVDTAQYSGDYERYAITANADGTVTVTDSLTDGDGDGSDTLTNIEALTFHDRYLRLGVETWVNKDPQSGKVFDVSVNGSLLSDTIDVAGDAYTGIRHVIHGFEGDDALTGGSGPDEFVGGAGDDVIAGGANGTDAWGNPGFDTVRYEGPYSRYTIEYSNDDGSTWADSMPENGTVLVRVTDSIAETDGGVGVDILSGIEAISFFDRFIMLEATRNVVDLNGDGRPDVSEIIGTDGPDILTGDITNDHIKGGAGNDTISGGIGGDILMGGAGNDTLNGDENGVDNQGRVLIDIAEYAGASSAYTVVKNENGSFTVSSTDEGSDTLTDIEGLQFSNRFVSLAEDRQVRDFNKDGAIDLIEIRGSDAIADTITVAAGESAIRHWIAGGDGNDTLTGGDAADVFEGGSGNDTIVGGDGAAIDRARFNGSYANYIITTSGEGITTVTHKDGGADGSDTLTGIEELAFNDKIYKIGAADVITRVEVDTDGNQKADTVFITGTAGGDSITGSASLVNFIDSGAGSDILTGGTLGDTFTPGAGGDAVDGGANEGLDAGGQPNLDRVVYSGAKADYAVHALQTAEFSLSGAVEVGDVVSLTVGGTEISYTATGTTLQSVWTGLNSAVQAAGLSGVVVSSVVNAGSLDVTVTSTDVIAGVIAAAANGTHAVSGSFTVNGANQSGSSMVVGSATGLEVGMNLSYSVTTGSGESATTTAYGPYAITAISGTTLTLDQSLGASPANGAALTVTEDNSDTTLAATAVTYDRWFEVSTTSGTIETDTLRGIEQLVFSDGVTNLSFTTSQTASFGASGLEAVTKIVGTDLADILYSSSLSEIFSGGGGADHFVFQDGSGDDKIQGFATGVGGDVLTLILGGGDTDGLNGSGVDTVSEALARATQQGSDVMIDLGAGNTIQLMGVSVDTLVAGNFEVLYPLL